MLNIYIFLLVLFRLFTGEKLLSCHYVSPPFHTYIDNYNILCIIFMWLYFQTFFFLNKRVIKEMRTSSVYEGAKITHTNIKHVPPKRKLPKYPNLWYSVYIQFQIYFYHVSDWIVNELNFNGRIYCENTFIHGCQFLWLTSWNCGLWFMVFNATFSYIVAVSIIGGGNRSTQRKPLTCRKSLTNFIT